jgi:hypothetical protein
MAGLIKWTVILSASGGVTAWVFAMASKLSSDQMGMLMMALIVILPLSAVLLVMVLKADSDRRMDHVERVEREKTERKRKGGYEPPVVIIAGYAQPQAPVIHNHVNLPQPRVDNNVRVQTAFLGDGTNASRAEANGKRIETQERRFAVLGLTEDDERAMRQSRGRR